MTARPEMTIPKSHADACFHFAMYVVVISFFLLAVYNLCHGDALVGSTIWVALVMLLTWEGCKKGGLRGFLVNKLGELVGRQFIEADSSGAPSRNVRFGFQFCGHRFIQRSLSVDAIESVEWSSGQATHFAKRDMNDWSVFVWYRHNDPVRTQTEKERQRGKPGEDLCGVGPSDRKERTEALGLALAAFLREAGVDLIPGDTSTCFVTRSLAAEDAQKIQAGA